MEVHGESFEISESVISSNYLLSITINEYFEFTDEYFDHIIALWKDKKIQEIFKTYVKGRITDSMDYFMNKINLIRQRRRF